MSPPCELYHQRGLHSFSYSPITGDYYFDEKADDWKIKKEMWLKKGTKVQKLKCHMPWFMETEIERILLENIDLIKFNKKNWNELESERRLYDEKIGRSIQIIDNLKGWKQKWEAASEDKKNEMLRLMTVKISTFSHKDTINGKDYEWKDLQIVWNEEFSDLFELGIFEQDKKDRAKNPAYGGSLIQFNSQKIRDGCSDH
jgi:hypothetical protein